MIQPRFKGCPPICEDTNLPSFKTPKEMGAFNDENSPHSVTLAAWQCVKCGGWHEWMTEGGNTNGGFRARSRDIPERITKMIQRTKKA
jgi:hypothetical protein